MAIDVRSYNQILGDMLRKIIADTPLNDINTGSVLLSLLEAAAQVDFENNASILNVLELLNIDAVRNNDLDARGADFGLVRSAAQRSSGFVTIGDSNITKRSTGLYQVKPPPIAGSTQIFVNDAADWSGTGNLYIGRGTNNFEGPIPYTSIVNNGSFFTINLGSALQKDHLISDVVVDGQGTIDRLVPAGTVVFIPANNQNPNIEFTTLRDAVIPAGEDTVGSVGIVAVLAGSKSNAGINTITNFASSPFSGATVTNTSALSSGRDVETDGEFRERIKSYANTLARGTKSAIISAIVGVSDSEDSKQVASAIITEPPRIGDPSILYIDDGSGFQPSFVGQSVDVLLSDASGNEEFLQLANYPLPRPQAINTVDGPFELRDQMQLRVLVDGVEEAVTFSASQFANIAAATVSEVIIAINSQSETFKATFTDNSSRILLFPVVHDAEIIQVAPQRATDDPLLFANVVLKFPSNEFSYIRLYQNNTLLNEKEKSASLLTTVFSTWNIGATGNLIISVDGTPAQDRSFDVTDFGGSPFASLTLEDWVLAFNAKFAGLTALATSSGRMQIISNKEGAESSLAVLGGTYFDKLFSNQEVEAVGQNSDFQLNRQTGNLRILTEIEANDSITAGTDDAKGNFISSETITGNYNVSTDSNSRPAEIVVVADANDVVPRVGVGLAVGNIITLTDQGSNVMRLMSDSLSSFDAVQPHDYLYIVSRGGLSPWINPANTGLYKIVAKGEHTAAGVDSYIEVKNIGIVPGVHTVQASEDIQAFASDKYPQLWKGSFTASPPSATIQNIVDTFNNNIVNVKATIFKTDSIKLTSTTEEDGSIAIPVSVGNAAALYDTQQEEKKGNPSHIANRVATKDVISFFKITDPTDEDADGVSGRTVWLDRVSFGDRRGALTSNAAPGTEGVDTYSEELQSTDALDPDVVDFDDIYNSLDGGNKGQYRSIRDKLAGDKVGTQHSLPRTLMDHIINDRFNLMRPVSINSEDSIVVILDQDAVAKTIDIKMSRAGRVSTAFPPTTNSFSAFDADNEPGVTFGNLQVWGKTANHTEFKDYGIWWRARNWYVSGGATSGGGAMVIRSREYGPHGENLRFRIEYPTFPSQTASISHDNTPDFSLSTYVFGSDVLKNINVSAGDTFSVSSLGGDDWRYTFSNPATDFSTVVVGDIISILTDAGVSLANRGRFRIKGVNDVLKYIDVYNPNGSATGVGAPEVTDITTIADVVGSKTVSVVSGVLAEAAIADDDFFTLNDSAGVVAVVYDKNSSVGTPASYGANRILVVTLAGGESASTVTALTSGVIAADPEFDASFIGTTITITNADNGAFAVAADGANPTGFGFAGTAGTADVSLDGLYFTLQDAAGSVAFWYDTTGITPEPLHGASRAVRISSVNPGDSANTVATKTAVVINGDAGFASATVLLNVITATDAANGGRPASSAGTSGFTVAQNSAGVNPTPETINIPTSVMVFPLLGTGVQDIVDTINNDSLLMYAAVVDDTNDITKATRDEEYTPAGPGDYSVSLSYGHDPDPSSTVNGYVSFYDGINWVKQFENSNPNFATKKSMVLQGVAPSAYSLETAPNHDTADLGEFFKLVPITLNNVYHHFTQKALSQLPIVSEVSISTCIRKIQIKSKLLGSEGAVEIVGGNANAVDLSIFGEGQVSPGASRNFLEVKTAAFPVTLTEGDYVELSNTESAKRESRLKATDTIDVQKGVGADVEYRWNHKDTNLGPHVRFTIADQSATYGRPAGTVWRWTHNDGGSYFDITADVNGAAAVGPDDEVAAGGVDAANLQFDLFDIGTASTPQHFRLTVSGVPSQADYYTFRTTGGVTFAVWFDVDAAGIAPTGATYVAATNKIEVDILSTDTEDQIVSKLAITLLANAPFLANFGGFQTEGANFDDVVEGDLLCVYGTFAGGWSSANKSKMTGDANVAGLPIIGVNSASRYVDVVNPDGIAMTNEFIGAGSIDVVPTPIIKWNLKHKAKTQIVQIVLSAPLGTGTVFTSVQHRLKEGDTVVIDDNGLAQTVAVATIPSPTSFTFTDTTGLPAGTYFLGNVIVSGATPTRYKIESLGFNNLYRLQYIDGDAPGFIDCGVAVDDIMVVSGNTFKSSNSGTFRVLGVDNSSIIFKNEIAVEELDTLVPFNNLSTPVNWTANLNLVTGTVGSFKNLVIGDWVKKKEDPDTYYRQVTALLDAGNSPTSAALAVKIQIGNNYLGTTAASQGVSFDQNSDVDKGVTLQSVEDIQLFEGDSVRIDDVLFVDNIADASWFSSVNSGSFKILQFGSTADCRPFVRIDNSAGQTQAARQIAVSALGYFILEGERNRYESLRRVEHTAIDSFNENRRSIYMLPPTRVYKVSQSYGTKVSPVGKLEYSTDVTTGIDGYTYYTGLMRTVQRIVDGFEPDPISFPGRRAIGGVIETLPPLIRRVQVSIEVTTNEGVNLNEITNDIKSAIINYINQLGVGGDVILSEMMVRIMSITGVEAVTFNVPAASTERISIADNEKAFIEPNDISVA